MANPCHAVILGAGASGLLAALEAGRRGRRVVVLDHARQVAGKVLVSGGGHCNITHRDASPDHYHSQNPGFCAAALSRFTPDHILHLLDRHRIAYHEKKPGQVFCRGSAREVVTLLESQCRGHGVQFHLGLEILEVAGPRPFRVTTNGGVFTGQRLVVASGGLARPKLGASNLGYRLATQFGHGVIPARPGLVPLTLDAGVYARLLALAGVALPVAARCGEVVYHDDMLFTHRGLSGPAILQLSNHWQPGALVELDLLPGQRHRLLDRFAQRPRALCKNLLGEFLPRRLVEALCPPELAATPVHRLSQEAFAHALDTVSRLVLKPMGTEGYRTAEVTVGGVDTRALTPETLESTLIPGLHFVGEVVDVTGELGGYNLQWAWASGHGAGSIL